MALVNALEENKELLQRIEKLEEENHIYKEILDQTRTLIEVLQVILSIHCIPVCIPKHQLLIYKCYTYYILLQEEIENNRNDINNSLDDSSLI